MIAAIINKKRLNPIAAELFIRGRILKYQKTKYNIIFYYENFKQKRTSTNCNKSLIDVDFKDFIKIYNEYTTEPYSFLVNNFIIS